MQRCRTVMSKLLEKFPSKDLILVTHASTLVGLTRALVLQGEVRCGVASIVHMEERDGKWVMIKPGSCVHLSSGEMDAVTDLPYEYWKPQHV